MRAARFVACGLMLHLAPGVAAAQEPALNAPANADSSPAAATIQGRALANKQSMDGRLAGGLVSGFFLGLIGTAVAWGVAGGDATPLPDSVALRVINSAPTYNLAFQQGYSERLRSRRKSSALTGGLIGTAVGATVIIIATYNN